MAKHSEPYAHKLEPLNKSLTAGIALTTKPNSLTAKLAPHDSAVKLSDDPLDDGYRFWALIGPKGSGKTNVLFNVLTKPESPWYKLFDRVFMFSPTGENADYLKPFIKDLRERGQFYEELNEQTLEDCLTKLERFNHHFVNERKPQTREMKAQELVLLRKGIKKEDMPDSILGEKVHKRKPHSLIIFDDCLNELKKSTEKSIQSKLWTRNRHYYTNIALTSQRYLKLNPTIRNNLDTISFWKTANQKEYETLEDDLNVDPKILKRVYDFATHEPFSFLHITFNAGEPKFFRRFDRIVL